MLLTAIEMPIATWVLPLLPELFESFDGCSTPSASAPTPESIVLVSFALIWASPPFALIVASVTVALESVVPRLIAIVNATALPPTPADNATAMMSVPFVADWE